MSGGGLMQKKLQADGFAGYYPALFLPLNPPQAYREFLAVFFVMRYARTAYSVSRTSLLRARAIDIIMRTMGHGRVGDYINLSLANNLPCDRLHGG